MAIDKKKPKPTGDNQVTTFRSGDALAAVWLREAIGGFCYLDFTLGRVYKSKQKGRETSSEKFFARNELALHHVIEQASAFIRAHQDRPEGALRAVATKPLSLPAPTRNDVSQDHAERKLAGTDVAARRLGPTDKLP